MNSHNSYAINPGWQIMLADLGISVTNVLRRAGLPGDLFARKKARLDTGEYFALWTALEEESNDPLLALHLGSSISPESFDPPVFAALCSTNLNTALKRISQYKRLIGPMALDVEIGQDYTDVGLRWLDSTQEPPQSLVLTDLVFFVHLARMATRGEITPLRVTVPFEARVHESLSDYLGVSVSSGDSASVRFSSTDAERRFLTENEQTWEFFEPALRQRLSELDSEAATSERVRAALLELLPGGETSIESVAERLGTSARTLQRRLSAEEDSFQSVLRATREELATHYLKRSELTGTEISFLLGYEEPNSFYRAFQSWTGKTPERVRAAVV